MKKGLYLLLFIYGYQVINGIMTFNIDTQELVLHSDYSERVNDS